MATHPRHAIPGKHRGRPKQLTEEEARRRENARRRRRWKRRANLINERRRERRFRFAHRFHVETGLAIVTANTLRRPPLLYIDEQGRLWQEDFRSAEQLIADWERARKKEGSPL
jgi:hypothetical protein